MNTGNGEAVAAMQHIADQNGEKMEVVPVKVNVDAEMMKKMKSLISLYSDEISPDAKRQDIVGFFLKKGFEELVRSGEFDRRLKAVLGE